MPGVSSVQLTVDVVGTLTFTSGACEYQWKEIAVNLLNSMTVALVCCLGLGGASGQGPDEVKDFGQEILVQPLANERLDKHLTFVPHQLSQWPSEKLLKSKKRLSSQSPPVKKNAAATLSWVKKIIDADWLPKEDPSLLFLRDEFQDWDTCRGTWDREGYKIQVSQTRSIFMIKLIPLDNKGTGEGFAARRKFARQLASKAFSNATSVYTWQLDRLRVSDLRERIAETSFSDMKTRMLRADQVAVGEPLTLEEFNQNSPSPVKSESGKSSFNYWYRNIYWWNDGNSVGFYFNKIDGPDANSMSWASSIDRVWLAD